MGLAMDSISCSFVIPAHVKVHFCTLGSMAHHGQQDTNHLEERLLDQSQA
jgi:hypothetical protein